jgi:hypothetical protein
MAIIDINIDTPNLQQVTDSGNTTNNDIEFTDNAGVLLENTSRLREGTIDSGAGGGIAQICAVGYELKWEAGSQYVMDGNGTLIREVNHKFNIIPDASNDDTQGFYVGSRWVLDNGDVYVCTDSTATSAVWEIVPNADWNATTGSTAIANKPTIPSTSNLVPYTGATNDVDLGVHDLTATQGTFATSGNPDTLTVNHSSGSGKALTITKGGNGEGVYVNKTSGSGNAVTIIGDLEATNLKRTGGTSSQFLKANGSIDSTSYQPTLVSGTNIKTVNGTSLLGSGDITIGGGSLTVGTTAIASGTVGRILFQGTGNVLQQDSALAWDNTLKRLTLRAVGASGTDIPFRVRNSADAADLFILNGNKAFNLGGGVSGDGFTTYLGSQTGVTQVTASGNGLTLTSNFFTTLNGTNQTAIQTNGVTRIHLDVGGNVGIGSATTLGARLDVRAQGALSTDIAFRVRNSADTLNIISANGAGDVFVGLGAGRVNTGSNNTFVGTSAGTANTSGIQNSFFGFQAGTANTTGGGNVFIGVNAGNSNTVGGSNIFLGNLAGQNNTDGASNLFLGLSAGRFIANGSTANTFANNSVFLGNNTKALANNQSNQIVIGDNATGAGSNTATIGNTSIVKTILRGTINAANLPTSPAGLVTGDIWNNLGILTIV